MSSRTRHERRTRGLLDDDQLLFQLYRQRKEDLEVEQQKNDQALLDVIEELVSELKATRHDAVRLKDLLDSMNLENMKHEIKQSFKDGASYFQGVTDDLEAQLRNFFEPGWLGELKRELKEQLPALLFLMVTSMALGWLAEVVLRLRGWIS